METLIPLLILVGSFAAFLSATLGLGGATVFVPVLLWLLPLLHVANSEIWVHAFATSVAAVAILAALSTLANFKHHAINQRIAKMYVPMAFIGGAIAPFVLHIIPHAVHGFIFSIYMFWLGVNMLRHQEPPDIDHLHEPTNRIAAFFAAMVSVLSGSGGAPIFATMLKNVLGLRLAVGTGTATSFSSALGGVLGFAIFSLLTTESLFSFGSQATGVFHIDILLAFAIPGIFLAKPCATLAARLPIETLKHSFAVFVCLAASFGIYSSGFIQIKDSFVAKNQPPSKPVPHAFASFKSFQLEDIKIDGQYKSTNPYSILNKNQIPPFQGIKGIPDFYKKNKHQSTNISGSILLNLKNKQCYKNQNKCDHNISNSNTDWDVYGADVYGADVYGTDIYETDNEPSGMSRMGPSGKANQIIIEPFEVKQNLNKIKPNKTLNNKSLSDNSDKKLNSKIPPKN